MKILGKPIYLMPIPDTSEEWVLKSTANVANGGNSVKTFEINFFSNNSEYDTLYFGMSDDPAYYPSTAGGTFTLQ